MIDRLHGDPALAPAREGADLEPPQRPAMAAERVRDCANVRPRAHPQVEPRDAVLIRDDVECVDTRATEWHLHGDAATRKLVGALADDLDRGCGRDRQLDVAAEVREPVLELVRRRCVELFDDLPFRVGGRRPCTEIDVRHISLVEPDEAPSQFSCRSGQQKQ